MYEVVGKKIYILMMIIAFTLTITISYSIDTANKIENYSNRNLTVQERVELSNIAELTSVESITVYEDIISIQTTGCYTDSECQFMEEELLDVNQTLVSEYLF